MQFLLTQEEMAKSEDAFFYKDAHRDDPKIMKDLRQKVLELAKFKCYHEIPEKEMMEVGPYIDEGYCDECPLSFCSNESKEMKYKLCGYSSTLYSK